MSALSLSVFKDLLELTLRPHSYPGSDRRAQNCQPDDPHVSLASDDANETRPLTSERTTNRSA